MTQTHIQYIKKFAVQEKGAKYSIKVSMYLDHLKGIFASLLEYWFLFWSCDMESIGFDPYLGLNPNSECVCAQ